MTTRPRSPSSPPNGRKPASTPGSRASETASSASANVVQAGRGRATPSPARPQRSPARKRSAGLRVAADIGGTFTDLVSYDAASGEVRFEKALTTPQALHDGVMQCFDKADVDVARTEHFIHGSTVAINAVIQRSGARTALVTTEGFADLYEVGRTNRPDTYNLFFEKTAPLVPATLRFAVRERMAASGRAMISLERQAIDQVIAALREARVEAIAVCLLHAYANPVHEQRLGRALRRAFPNLYITLSHEILREYREFERTSTTVLNAYVGPQVSRYLEALLDPLGQQAFAGRFLIMQSNGGVMSHRRASRMPVAMMESGPAGGIIGAGVLGEQLNMPDVIAFDMGGTTAKTCLVEQGQPRMTDQYFIGGYLHGHPMRLPVVDIIEVGAGGGSIAWIDEGGSLKVGPRSAGSSPGPACYGRGGTEPTVTDANLVTGRLNPTRFLGGEFDLDIDRAREAIRTRIADPLGLTVTEAALGILRIADAKMSLAVRAITLQRGHDPRRFAMVVFGGGGPLHGIAIARELHVPRVIIPPQPGHFSALGMLMTDLRQDFVQTRIIDFAATSAAELEQAFRSLADDALASMSAEGEPVSRLLLQRSVDMRYLGQEYTVRVPVEGSLRGAQSMNALRERFDELYSVRYGHAAPDQQAEIVNLRMTAFGRVDKPAFASLRDKRIGVAVTATRRRVVFEGAGALDCPVLQRAQLVPGRSVAGPAIIEEYASTTLLHPGDRATLLEDGSILVSLPVGESDAN